MPLPSGYINKRTLAVDGEVAVKNDAVDICGSDMQAWHLHDSRHKPGLVLGHEFVGGVVELLACQFEPVTRFAATS